MAWFLYFNASPREVLTSSWVLLYFQDVCLGLRGQVYLKSNYC